MEPAWHKVNQGNFSLVNYTDVKGESRPCYSLTKTESLFIATKFNDVARAKLVLRWEELEREKQSKPMTQIEMLLQSAQAMYQMELKQQALEQRTVLVESRMNALIEERQQATADLLEAELSQEAVPEVTLRNKVRQLVAKYSVCTNISFRTVWHMVYDRLYYSYHIRLQNTPTKLDDAEKRGVMDKLYNIISNLIREYNARNEQKIMFDTL